MGTRSLGKHSLAYRKGHALDSTGWFAYRPAVGPRASTRLLWSTWGNDDGHDAGAHRMIIPTIREDLTGGLRMDLPVGVNDYFADAALRGHRTAAQWHASLYQDLHGP